MTATRQRKRPGHANNDPSLVSTGAGRWAGVDIALPPDEWALEPKIDGVRVIWLDGHPFTRHGGLLTSGKGADRLTQILAKIPHTLDGEWVQALDTFFAFDLPECPLDYDGRHSALTEILTATTDNSTDVAAFSLATSIAHVRLVASFTGQFPAVYSGLKGHGAEGVVLKRRRALYGNQLRPGVESRDWLKRRFGWD